jgi:ribulose-5-phosphate 4-epimerase/fuculose-1-phosphate aldolase
MTTSGVTTDRDFLDPSAGEPAIADPAELRGYRKRQLALAYRVFGAAGWGTLGDGHISARDPERTDCFWLGRYGAPFRRMTVEDLVLVRPDGSIEGGGHINPAAYWIHAPVHEARPDIVSAAHCHTPYGTPFSAMVAKLEPISQEACYFYEDHEIFDDEEVDIKSTDGGKRIATAIGDARAVVLRNHGLLTVAGSVAAAVGFFMLMERCAEVQVKARDARPISPEAARIVHDDFDETAAWQVFQWAHRTLVPDGI